MRPYLVSNTDGPQPPPHLPAVALPLLRVEAGEPGVCISNPHPRGSEEYAASETALHALIKILAAQGVVLDERGYKPPHVESYLGDTIITDAIVLRNLSKG